MDELEEDVDVLIEKKVELYDVVRFDEDVEEFVCMVELTLALESAASEKSVVIWTWGLAA